MVNDKNKGGSYLYINCGTNQAGKRAHWKNLKIMSDKSRAEKMFENKNSKGKVVKSVSDEK